MNKTEKKGYNWLLSKGYSTDEIKFQSSTTPDFLTSDGCGWEIKRIFAQNKIYMSYSQFDRLKQMNNTQIVIFNDEYNFPIFTIESNMISVGKIHTEISITVPIKSVTKSITITKDQQKYIEDKYINLSRLVQRALNEQMRERINEFQTHINYTVNVNTGT